MKGISAVIATIMLVAITVGIIILLNVWFPSLFSSQTETIEESSDVFAKCVTSTLDIEQVRYTSGSRLVNVTATSTGSEVLKNVTISIVGSGLSTISYKLYNVSGDDLLPGTTFALSVNTTNGATVPPELVTVSGFCQSKSIVTDTCKAGESCMKPT